MKNIFIVLTIIVLPGCFGRDPQKTGFEGKEMPSFKLFLSDSTTYFDTKNIPTGKPIVLFYFGPHCPYSMSEMEDITKNMQSLKDISFYIFTTWPYKEMKNFYKKYDLIKYPNIISGVDYANFFSNYMGVPGVPYTAIYDKNKRLKEAFLGKINSDQIKSAAKD